MCGRYTLLADELEILQEFGLEKNIKSYQPSFNIAPGQNVLAIIHDGKEKRAGYLRWGLVPSWAKDEKIGYKMINARSETAHKKPSFKKLMARKRCLITADSFYEWEKTDEGKQPKRIQLPDRQVFAFAGLWDKWVQEDKVIFTCTILTKEANEFMQGIHHRMPIILPKNKQDEWIKPEQQSPDQAYDFLQTIKDDPLTAYNVNRYVNAAKNDDAACIEPMM
ncbi:putative SOS response-associated peptidase YedK [Virgibacillus natechei]|uniref:Abasic site processing protein n=1 Tax=Virgibacillus natechei TaxID=1216297 RepID=A0ABS4II52_9BACI|nr:SOS response-associated peptidase [Virgibacillus natechei]MBP1970623.1 putative SOS response-associated peptidase YedK [Virgibacillus natechei]UZD13987.1 SOS response-associated peptidase [Virgibacillus natechei]